MLTNVAATTSSQSIFSILALIAVGTMILCFYGGILYLFILIVRALRKYLKSEPVRKETAAVRRSLGEALKVHRTECKMTQEFVAEHLGVSRQAVSKWETGASDPSTSNLLALAKLYGIRAEELLQEIQE